MTSILSILLGIVVIAVVVWLILQIPMIPAEFRNIIIGVAILLTVLWLLGQLGGFNLGFKFK